MWASHLLLVKTHHIPSSMACSPRAGAVQVTLIKLVVEPFVVELVILVLKLTRGTAGVAAFPGAGGRVR